MIKIKNIVEVEIGERKFTLVVNRLSSAQQKSIELMEKEHTDMIEHAGEVEKNIAELNISIAEMESSLATNSELLKLKDVSLGDRLSLLWENKKNAPALADLKRRRMTLSSPSYLKSIELIEGMFKKRFELAVTDDEQKAQLIKYATENEVSYTEIYTEINNKIAEENKKK